MLVGKVEDGPSGASGCDPDGVPANGGAASFAHVNGVIVDAMADWSIAVAVASRASGHFTPRAGGADEGAVRAARTKALSGLGPLAAFFTAAIAFNPTNARGTHPSRHVA
jgi:hypothetical protein